MFSRIAKVTSFAKRPSVLFRVVSTSSTKPAAASSTNDNVKRYPHDAPERDFVNFPAPRQPEEPGKLKVGFVPAEWFNFLSQKTGVTGPYVLFWGGVATILSKEYFVYWADTAEQLVFLGALIGITKMYGSSIAKSLDKQVDAENKAYNDNLNAATKDVDVKIKENEALFSLPEANKIVHSAKKENILMQLEAAYRQRLTQIHQEVKRRLDYQLAIQNAYKRLEREQAINYIIGEVNKSIGATQEKDAFQNGLGQLKQLSQKYAGTI